MVKKGAISVNCYYYTIVSFVKLKVKVASLSPSCRVMTSFPQIGEQPWINKLMFNRRALIESRDLLKLCFKGELILILFDSIIYS